MADPVCFELVDFYGNGDDLEDIYGRNEQRISRRYVRDTQNPLHWWNNSECRQRYRFSKVVLHVILPILLATLEKPDKRGRPIEPVMQSLWCLQFYATGSFQVRLTHFIY